MHILGLLIYELNKCAVPRSIENMRSCEKMLRVCKSYAHQKDDFGSLLDALPTQLITHEIDRLNKEEKTKVETGQATTLFKTHATSVKTLDDLRDIIFTLITASKTGAKSSSETTNAYALISGLQICDWGTFQTGKTI